VLAVDPATVDPPVAAAAAAAPAACPAASPTVLSSAPGSGKTVALTFDDGPGASTVAILQILEDEGVPATFFNIGVNMTVRPATVQAEYTQAFLLGNHTWDHPELPFLTTAGQAAEMDNQINEQISLTGSRPCFFRPPYGEYDATTLSLAAARSMRTYNWSVDTEDWKANHSGAQTWIDRIIRLGTSGGGQAHPVVLMHNQPQAMPATVAALPTIIAFYRDRGYTFVDLAGNQAVRPVSGDWDGNGTTTPGLVVGNRWYLWNRNAAGPADITFAYGGLSDRLVTGDWDGNGTTTIGVVRGNGWYLRNSNNGGPPDLTFAYGRSTDRYVTGDWNGDGTTTPGYVRGTLWGLRNQNTTGSATTQFTYGATTDRVVTGDWDGNGTTTIGVVRGIGWYLRNANNGGPPNLSFSYGQATDRILTGDWDGNGTTTPGYVRGPVWGLRNVNTTGARQVGFPLAPG
jgi:peptidoglycan/xylan/chitin deacetylase (PgdA/CDA1 family)